MAFSAAWFSPASSAGHRYVMKCSPPSIPRDAERLGSHHTPRRPFFGGGVSGILLGAVGQLGDLLESLLKRDAGVRTPGTVPGFGGVLDILDRPYWPRRWPYWLLKLVLR